MLPVMLEFCVTKALNAEGSQPFPYYGGSKESLAIHDINVWV